MRGPERPNPPRLWRDAERCEADTAVATRRGDALTLEGIPISDSEPKITIRSCEAALRAAGVPRRLAAKIVRDGFKAAVGGDDADVATVADLVFRLETATSQLKDLHNDHNS